MAYSMDLRERVVAAVKNGEKMAAVARRFAVAWPTVRQWCARAQQGQLAARTPGPKGPIKLCAEDDRVMREQVAAKPGITAKELMPMLSVPVAESTICRRLIKLKLNVKKNR